jgi:hypothetical protein
MKKFLDWFEKESSTDLVLKAGVAHLWFVTAGHLAVGALLDLRYFPNSFGLACGSIPC